MTIREVIADMRLYVKDGLVVLPGSLHAWIAALEQAESGRTAPNTGSPKLPTLESVQQAVIDAQLCAHGQVEVATLIKFVHDHICRQLQAGA